MSTDDERREVLASLGDAGRQQSTAVVLFHTNLAARMGLGATEVKVLELVARHPSLTPKELRDLTGLAPASITGILDRLEAKGYVTRRVSARDRRSVDVVYTHRHAEAAGELFAGLLAELDALHGRYSTAELRLILDYVRSAADIQQRAALELAER